MAAKYTANKADSSGGCLKYGVLMSLIYGHFSGLKR